MESSKSEFKEFKAKPVGQRTVISGASSAGKKQFESPPLLLSKIKKYLPENYNFEIPKILARIEQLNAKRICLQFPEGLFLFSTIIADLIVEFAKCEVIIIGDVTYGACCIDDYVAALNECQLIVHFAHSCLIPVNEMVDNLKVLYIFVDIKFDIWHCVETFKKNFPLAANGDVKFAIAGSIQFVSSVHSIAKALKQFGYSVHIPQAKPLSPGEVLGCTAPRLSADTAAVFFVCDGRFHLEAVMIANPFVKKFYKYNPYDKQLTEEEYEFDLMMRNREKAIRTSIDLLDGGKPDGKPVTIGLILGTLGHQGSVKVLNNLRSRLLVKNLRCDFINILIPEINATLLNSFGDAIDIWLQISCPRLSIDWALDVIEKPLLTPFEFNVVLEQNFSQFYSYPMDFYTANSLGNWTPNHKCHPACSCEPAI